MNVAQKKKKLGWKLNKEQKSVHAVKSYLHQLKSNIHTKNMTWKIMVKFKAEENKIGKKPAKKKFHVLLLQTQNYP